MTAHAIRLLLVDDHPTVLLGLECVLSAAADMEVVGVATTGEEALAAFIRLQPDVVLMDLSMPGEGGLRAMQRVRDVSASAKVLILTSSSDDQTVAEALRSGAAGFVLKDGESSEITQAIRGCARGELPIDPRVTRSLLSQKRTSADVLTLTPREHDVLRLLKHGLANKQIAARLGIRETTVKAHLSSAFHRIGVADRTSAAIWAEHHLDDVRVS